MKVILFFAFTFPALCVRIDQATDSVAMDAIEIDLGKVESTVDGVDVLKTYDFGSGTMEDLAKGTKKCLSGPRQSNTLHEMAKCIRTEAKKRTLFDVMWTVQVYKEPDDTIVTSFDSYCILRFNKLHVFISMLL